MGIFGPIEDNKALEIIKDNFDIIVTETMESMATVNASRGGGASGLTGEQLMWNMVARAEIEIPAFITKLSLNIPLDYPFGDPSKYVACSIYSRYVNATKDDKKILSSGIKGIKKDGVQGLVDDITKVYCDNIERSLVKYKLYDKSKETAIKSLAESFKYYKLIFPQENKLESSSNDGTSRTRKK